MSYRVTYLKCAHCNEEYDNIYVSFGHPENDFDFVWDCEKCDTENTLSMKFQGMAYRMLLGSHMRKKTGRRWMRELPI